MYAQPSHLLPNFVSGNAAGAPRDHGQDSPGDSLRRPFRRLVDWATHLAMSPSQQPRIRRMGVRQWEVSPTC